MNEPVKKYPLAPGDDKLPTHRVAKMGLALMLFVICICIMMLVTKSPMTDARSTSLWIASCIGALALAFG
jgi:hypothetical protein